MRLPFQELHKINESITQVRVKEVDTHREGEPLKTGGWVCYTVKKQNSSLEHELKKLQKRLSVRHSSNLQNRALAGPYL